MAKTTGQHSGHDLGRHTTFPAFSVEGELPRGPLERILSLFADVRAGEGASALLLMVNIFLLLGAYYLLKTAREPLILTEGGAAAKSYSSAGQAVLLLLALPIYGAVASRVGRVKLIVGLLLFFAANLLVFQLLGANGTAIGVAFYVWVGIFNMFAISQLWAFGNDLYTEAQGKRLFPMVGVGASLGAWIGAQAATALFRTFHLTPYALMAGAAGVLVVCAVLVVVTDRIQTRPAMMGLKPQADAEEKISGEDGFRLIWRSAYLRNIAGLIVLLNVVNTTGEFLLSRLVEQEALRQFAGNKAAMQTYIGGFYGEYFQWVNLVGLLLQTFAVSRIFSAIGVRGALFILPSLALTSYSFMAAVPILSLVRLTKIAENSIDYSLNNTVRQALFLPTSRAEKYKAKAAIDTFFARLGDVLQAGFVRVGLEVGASFSAFAWLNVGLTVAWLALATSLSRQHRRMGF